MVDGWRAEFHSQSPEGGLPKKKSFKEALKMCTCEIKTLRQFFQDWLSGELPNTDVSFRRARRALAPGFSLIHLSGEWRSREDILVEAPNRPSTSKSETCGSARRGHVHETWLQEPSR